MIRCNYNYNEQTRIDAIQSYKDELCRELMQQQYRNRKVLTQSN